MATACRERCGMPNMEGIASKLFATMDWYPLPFRHCSKTARATSEFLHFSPAFALGNCSKTKGNGCVEIPVVVVQWNRKAADKGLKIPGPCFKTFGPQQPHGKMKVFRP